MTAATLIPTAELDAYLSGHPEFCAIADEAIAALSTGKGGVR